MSARAGKWVGAAIIVAAVAGAVAWFVLGFARFGDAVDDLERVAVPGTAFVGLSEGRKAIYYEGPGGEDADIPPLQVSVIPVGGGGALTIEDHSGKVTYSVSGHAGRSFAGMSVPSDGQYAVSVEAPSGAPGNAQIAIGRGLGRRLLVTLLGAFAILLAGVGGGVALIVITARRRSSPAARP